MNMLNNPKRCVAAVLAFLALCGSASAATVLDYPPAKQESAAQGALAVPVSAFHDWSSAQDEAKRIIAAWQTEPASLAWTRVQLARHIKHKMSPTRGARGLALVHVAMYDAYQRARKDGVDPKLALSMAAAEVLSYLYAAEERAFERIAFAVAAQETHTDPEHLPTGAITALRLGREVGRRVVDYAQQDGAQRGWNGSRLQWYGDGRYYGPGTWEPTPPYFYYPPDEPFAPGWKTWVLKSADEFRPTPPAFGSERFLKDLQEVIEINLTITPEQMRIAKFWVDGSGSMTPPGHWNMIAIDEVIKAKLDDEQTLRLFAQLNIAMSDTFIAVWDCKYFYWTIRPITAAKKVFGVDFMPAILTPPFPSFPSGHSAFSGAAARILGVYFPNDAKRFDTMAEEAAMSRLFGGIHYRFDNDEGITLGRRIADRVLAMKPLK